ncbi:hypothetical protein Tco_0230919 [Tanacetum coccineum]
MTIGLDLPSRILEAQKKAVKVKNIEAEDIEGMLKKLEACADGTLCLDNRRLTPPHMLAKPDLCQGQGLEQKEALSVYWLQPDIHRMD